MLRAQRKRCWVYVYVKWIPSELFPFILALSCNAVMRERTMQKFLQN
ncbi:rCG35690, partial [Rattus norvegicus]